MTDMSIRVREHYSAAGLTDRIKQALATIAAEDQTLTVAQLAQLDQFHTRGIAATVELASAASVESSTGVLESRLWHRRPSALPRHHLRM